MNFSRTSMALGVIAALALPATAHAQVTDEVYDSANLQKHEGRGYLLSKGLLLRSSIGIAGGYNDNVFGEAGGDQPLAAGLVNLGARLYLSTENLRDEDLGDPDVYDAELTPRSYEFQGRVHLGYTEYMSGNDAVRSQRRFDTNASLNAVANPGGQASLIAQERFSRDMRAPNLEDDETIGRDDNRLMVGVRFRPSQQASSFTLRYENWLSVFEEDGPLVGRMNHTVGARADMVFGEMTRTRLLGDISFGFFGPLGDGSSMVYGERFKSRSQPFRVSAGVESELTPQITVRAHGGYSRSDYDFGADYSAPNAGAAIAAVWATGRVSAVYDYDHFDSVNANYYRDHLFGLKFVQQIEYLVLDGGPEVRLRHFAGIPMALGPSERDDVVIAARARAQLLFANRYSIAAEYRLAHVSTDYVENAGDSPSFVRNELMLGVWAAF